MKFLLKNFEILNGARFVGTELIITVNITSYCDMIPYEAFYQVDYQIDLLLDPSMSANDLVTQLPILVQNWINSKYPNI